MNTAMNYLVITFGGNVATLPSGPLEISGKPPKHLAFLFIFRTYYSKKSGKTV